MDLYEVILGRKLTSNKDKEKKVVIKTDKTKYKLKTYKVDDTKLNNINYSEEDFKNLMNSVAFQSYFN